MIFFFFRLEESKEEMGSLLFQESKEEKGSLLFQESIRDLPFGIVNPFAFGTETTQYDLSVSVLEYRVAERTGKQCQNLFQIIEEFKVPVTVRVPPSKNSSSKEGGLGFIERDQS